MQVVYVIWLFVSVFLCFYYFCCYFVSYAPQKTIVRDCMATRR